MKTFCSIISLSVVLGISGCSGAEPTAVLPAPVSVPPPAPIETVASVTTAAPPVVFVGLDGASWTLLDPYIGRGVMPNLARLVGEGMGGLLDTNLPAVSPMVWTSMMTGRNPLEHGVLDFLQFSPATGAREPIGSISRRVPAIWNMTSNAGKKVSAIGVWATYPAEPVNGLLVSDGFFGRRSTDPVGLNLVYPAERGGWARDLLARAEESVDATVMRAYLPWLGDAEYQKLDLQDPYAHPANALRRIVIESRAQVAMAGATLDQDHPDLTIVSLPGLDAIAKVFGPYVSPGRPGITQEDHERYRSVPEQYLTALDADLGELRARVERAGAVLVIASDRGSEWPAGAPGAPATGAARAPGLYLLWGPGISAGPRTRRATVEQVAPTLLALAGLPPAEGLPAVLPGAPAGSATTSVDYRTFYRPVEPPSAVAAAPGEADALVKLRSLGYIADAAQATGRTGDTRTPGSYDNEGLILLGDRRTTEAAAAFERALEVDPNFAPALWHLSERLAASAETGERSDALLIRAYGAGLADGGAILIRRATAYQRAKQSDRALRLVNGALDAKPDDRTLWLHRGQLRLDMKDCTGAATDFRRAAALSPTDAAAYASEGHALICAGDRVAARTALSRSLELEPNQPRVARALNALGAP